MTLLVTSGVEIFCCWGFTLFLWQPWRSFENGTLEALFISLTYRLKTWDGIDQKLDRYLKPVRSVNVILFAGFICTIVGGAMSNPSNSNANTGFKLRRAGDILFLVCNVIILGTVAWMSYSSVTPKERFDPIIVQLFIVLPLMLLRMVYATVAAFLESPENSSYNIWIYFGLLSLPDFLSTAIFTFCGVFWLRPTQRTALEEEHAGMRMEMRND